MGQILLVFPACYAIRGLRGPRRFIRDLMRGSEESGLGPAIARSIVEAHGGSISAESMPGAGTTIKILLPM